MKGVSDSILSKGIQTSCKSLKDNVNCEIAICRTFHVSGSRLNHLVPVKGRSKLPRQLSPLVRLNKSIVSTSEKVASLVQNSVKLLSKQADERQQTPSRRELRKMMLELQPKPKELFRPDRRVVDFLFKYFDPPSVRWKEAQAKLKEVDALKKNVTPVPSTNPLELSLALTSFMSVEAPMIDSLETRRGLCGTVLPSRSARFTTPYTKPLVSSGTTTVKGIQDSEAENNEANDGLKDRFVMPPRIRLRNISFETSPNQIRKWFSRFDLAEIERPVELIYYPNGRFSGMAYISFSREAEAVRAARRMNYLWMESRPLRIDIVENNKDIPRSQR